MFQLWLVDHYHGDSFPHSAKFETVAEAEKWGNNLIKRHAERCDLKVEDVQFSFKIIAI